MAGPSEQRFESEVGSLLLKEKVISSEKLEQAYRKAHATHKPLLDCLEEEGIDSKRLYQILSYHTGLPFIDLTETPIAPGVIDRVPVKIAWHYGFMPVKISGHELTVAVEYPLNVKTQDEVRLQLGFTLVQMLGRKSDIADSLKHHYGLAADTVEKIYREKPQTDKHKQREEFVIQPTDARQEDASVIHLVNEIILEAHHKRATDIHFEPYRGQFRLRYRIDGVLSETTVSEKVKYLIPSIISRIKIMSNLDIVEHRLPQDGRTTVKIDSQSLDLRISSIPTPYGESVVIRLLPMRMVLDLAKLGFSPAHLETLEKLIHKPHGILFLTGPTGSGKTTTLYGCLSRLNKPDKKIVTIEDPIEYEMPGITQIQVMPKIGLSFAQGLRSVLRHDPDVLMVGEVRDIETAEIAIRSALTGHLVFSTLHTNDAPSGVTRLLDIGLEPYLVASSVEAIIAQRLVRTLCTQCKTEPTAASGPIRDRMKQDLGAAASGELRVWKAKGCPHCHGTGYYGRVAIHEFMVLDDDLRRLILKKESASALKVVCREKGMTHLIGDGWQKVMAGLTTPEEILSVADVSAAL